MSFNDRASHISKTDNNKQKINAPNNSSGNNANFTNRFMSVNVYNFDAHHWPNETILIAGDLHG